MANLDEHDEDLASRIEHYNPITVNASESVGTIALAVVSLILLFALLRSQRRVRELQEQQGRVDMKAEDRSEGVS